MKKILKFVLIFVVILGIVFLISFIVVPIINVNYTVETTDLLNKTYIATDTSEMLEFISLNQVEKTYITSNQTTTMNYTLSAPIIYLDDNTTYLVNKDNLYSITNKVYLELVEEI